MREFPDRAIPEPPLFFLVFARAREAPQPAGQGGSTFLLPSKITRLFAILFVFFPGQLTRRNSISIFASALVVSVVG